MVSDCGQAGYRGFLGDDVVTIAETLRPAGYHALLAGKWHVGETEVTAVAPEHDAWPFRQNRTIFPGR